MWIFGLIWNVWLFVAVGRYSVNYNWYPRFHCDFIVQAHHGLRIWERDHRSDTVLCWQEGGLLLPPTPETQE